MCQPLNLRSLRRLELQLALRRLWGSRVPRVSGNRVHVLKGRGAWIDFQVASLGGNHLRFYFPLINGLTYLRIESAALI